MLSGRSRVSVQSSAWSTDSNHLPEAGHRELENPTQGALMSASHYTTCWCHTNLWLVCQDPNFIPTSSLMAFTDLSRSRALRGGAKMYWNCKKIGWDSSKFTILEKGGGGLFYFLKLFLNQAQLLRGILKIFSSFFYQSNQAKHCEAFPALCDITSL